MKQPNPSMHELRKQEIIDKINLHKVEYGEVLVKSAILYNRSQWENYTSHFILLPKEEKHYPVLNEKLEYDNVIFMDTIISLNQFLKIIHDLPEKDEITIPLDAYNVMIQGEGLCERTGFSSGKQYLGIPWYFDRYEYRTKTINRPSGPLISTKHPVYPYFETAIESRFLVSLDHSDARGVIFCLPHYQARIEEVSIGQESMKIRIYPYNIKPRNIIGKLYCENDLASFQTDINFKSKVTTVKIGFIPDRLHLYLLNKVSEEILDVRQYLPQHYWHDTGIFVDLPEEELYERIKQGESLTLEFKRALGDKTDDFVETVVAFANTKGGLILLGVEDDSQIIGMKKEYSEADISNAIRDRCDPFIQVNVHNTAIHNKLITVIQVPVGNDKPYCLRDKGPLIRAGSTDRPMRRIELEEIYNTKSSNPFSY